MNDNIRNLIKNSALWMRYAAILSIAAQGLNLLEIGLSDGLDYSIFSIILSILIAILLFKAAYHQENYFHLNNSSQLEEGLQNEVLYWQIAIAILALIVVVIAVLFWNKYQESEDIIGDFIRIIRKTSQKYFFY